MVDVDDITEVVDPVQADLEARLARLWSTIEFLDRYSWRVLEGVVDDDAGRALAAAYTSASDAARVCGLRDLVGSSLRSTLAVVATMEREVSWTSKRWVEYAALGLVCRVLDRSLPLTGEPAARELCANPPSRDRVTTPGAGSHAA